MKVGDIAHYRYANRGAEWFIVTDVSNSLYPMAVCIFSTYADPRVGMTFGVPGGHIVQEDEVPDEVWAALAKWRLTQ